MYGYVINKETDDNDKQHKIPEIHRARRFGAMYRGFVLEELSRTDLEAALCESCEMLKAEVRHV